MDIIKEEYNMAFGRDNKYTFTQARITKDKNGNPRVIQKQTPKTGSSLSKLANTKTIVNGHYEKQVRYCRYPYDLSILHIKY